MTMAGCPATRTAHKDAAMAQVLCVCSFDNTMLLPGCSTVLQETLAQTYKDVIALLKIRFFLLQGIRCYFRHFQIFLLQNPVCNLLPYQSILSREEVLKIKQLPQSRLFASTTVLEMRVQ